MAQDVQQIQTRVFRIFRTPLEVEKKRMFLSRFAIFTATFPVACFLMLTTCSAPAVKGQDASEKNQPTSYWMQKKLEYSKNILAGIAVADFDKIVQNAESMRRLSTIEGFIRGRTPGYRTQLQIFEQSADEIIRQGQKDNVDGAALAFTQLTINCVNCHKQIREHK
jgi:hypothetical protein